MGSWRAFVVAIMSMVSVTVTPNEATPVQALRYAPLDRPGPPLSVPAAALAQSLSCTGDLSGAGRVPVLFVPATMLTPEEQYSWNYLRAFDALGWPYCTVTTPRHGLEDMQVSGEYVVFAIRTMYQRAGRPIAILGGSQGGSLPRWALRFWPDTRSMVDDHVGLSPTNHGAQSVALFCVPDCAPSLWQQRYQSNFMRAMNSGQETFAGVFYTEVYSHQDEILIPAADDNGAAGLHDGGGRVTNVAVQEICPAHVASHVQMVTYDSVGYALAIDALTHDGPADPARIGRAVCTQEFPPGVDPATFPTNYLHTHAVIVTRLARAARMDDEPPLRAYVIGP